MDQFCIRASISLPSGSGHPKGLFTHLSGNCAEKGGGQSIWSSGTFRHLSVFPFAFSTQPLLWWLQELLTRWLKAQSVQDLKGFHAFCVGSCHKDLLKVMVRSNRFHLLIGERKLTCRNRDISVVILRMPITAASNIFLNGIVCRASAREASTVEAMFGHC